jgi:GT2 family glycosyltransferase
MDPGTITVVVATRDRRGELARTLDHLGALPERPAVVVVDNGSRDGTPRLVRDRYPQVELVRLARNAGACARNIGVLTAQTRYVAFSDDDSWWAPGALAAAARILDAHPRLGLLAARTLVGPDGRADPVNDLMANSPLPAPPAGPLPGPRVLGFLACAAVVRRAAFLDVGGFSPLLFFGGEEQLLAYDLAAAGWHASYCAGVVAHHFPSPARDPGRRDYLCARNRVLVAWLRRPARAAWPVTAALIGRARRDRLAARALAGVLVRAPVVAARRRVVPPELESAIRLLARHHPH